ncbi:ROK family protein [Neptuniibacter caesariensis]|uniref:ROK protein n=1 Tax=Neptuniibacter caesariensis TaxID=207954 RepID=A0A7U8C3G3_NEPCE|nr:ROK family protein [Neptuniibacter caesariensis]EAR60798.1 ROK protein [Oceanospirillum sp. MED92] [Neptuniibacter caesariensis]
MSYRIGIDLGGTKIEVIAISDDSSTLFRQRISTPQGNYTATIDAIDKLVSLTEQTLSEPALSVGVGIPGAVSPASGLVKNANSVCLIGNRLDVDLSNKLQRSVKIANDADCFTLSEACDGAGAGYSTVFGVILGTGVGGGICVNQQLLSGPNAITGEWGHNPLPWLKDSDRNNRPCYCGKTDCIETFLSGPGFEKSFSSHYGKHLSSDQIWSRAKQGNDALADTHLYLDQLARALASVINILDPGVIVLGGGLSNQGRIYQELPALLSQYVFSDQVDTPIVKAIHGDSSGVRGAAWLS